MKKLLVLFVSLLIGSHTYLLAQNGQAYIYGAEETYCIFGQPGYFIGVPQGGTFTGPGMDGDMFFPQAAGMGTHTIKYIVNDSGMTLTASINVTVTDTVYGQIIGPNGPFNSVCVSGESIPLNSVPYPANYFYGPGVVSQGGMYYLNPTQLDPGGIYTIYAMGATPQGCSFSASHTFNVTFGTTQAQILNIPPQICASAPPIALQAVPPGGTFYLNGMPLWADSSGITYLYPNMIGDFGYLEYEGYANGCGFYANDTLNVIQGADAHIMGVPEAVCVGSQQPVFLQGMPEGGNFIITDGMGVVVQSGPSGMPFYPQMPGIYIISYSGNAGGCNYSASQALHVLPGIVGTAQTVPASCPTCADGWAYVVIQGGNSPFYYLSLSDGTNHTINAGGDTLTNLLPGTYVASFSDPQGACSSSFSFTIESLTQGCNPPVSLTYTNIQTGSVLLQWDAVPSAVSYTLRYRKQGGTSWLSLNVSTNYRVLTNLSPTTTYEWIVRANCINVGPGSFSPISNFTAIGGVPPCTRPTGLMLISLQPNDIGLSWDAQPGAMYYEVQYRKSLGGSWISTFVTTNSIFITSLTPGTVYTARVRSRCGEYDTPWSNTISFQTPMAKLEGAIQYTETNSFSLSLYPNPNKGLFNLQLEQAPSVALPVTIMDMTGRTVLQQSIQSTETSFDLSNYAKGIYLLKVGDKTAKVIVE